VVGDSDWDAVRLRVGQFEAGDLTAVLDADGVAAARRLAAVVSDDAVAVTTLAAFYYCRFQAPQEGDGVPDLLEACGLYALVYADFPGSCPPELAVVLRALTGDLTAGYDRDARNQLNDAAVDFLAVTEQVGDIRGAEAACTCLRAAMSAAGYDDPDRPDYLANLAMSLLSRFEELGERADIDAAVDAARDAVDVAEPDTQAMGRYWSGLAATLTARAVAFGSSADLDEAVESGHKATAMTERDDPVYAGRVANFSAALLERSGRTGDLADVNAALQTAADAVAATGQEDPQLAGRLSNLAAVLSLRFELAGDPGDLNRSAALQRQAITALPAESPDASAMLSNLAVVLVQRFDSSGDLTDLDDAIDSSRSALRGLPAGHPGRPPALHNLATCLAARGQLAENQADLDEAVAAGSAAVELLPDDHADHAAFTSGLGNALLARYEHTGNAVDLDRGAGLLADVLARAPADRPEYAGWRTNYGNARLHQFRRSGVLADADDAICHYLRALDETPAASPERTHRLENLAAAYRQRALVTGDTGDLDRAVTAAAELVLLVPDNHPRYADVRVGLSEGLRLRSERTGSLADADRAIEVAEQAAGSDLTLLGPAGRAGVLTGLVKALLTRFDRTGLLADADRAVAVAGQAAGLMSGHPDEIVVAGRTTDLANALLARGQYTGSSADSAQAVELIRAAVRRIPPGHPGYPGRLVNLANVLMEHANRLDPAAADGTADQLRDLGEAATMSAEAMRRMPARHHEWWMAAAAHGNALLARFEMAGDLADLSASIEAYRRALASMPDDHPDRAGQLANLGNAVHLRFEAGGRPEDLAWAIDQLRTAVRGSDPGQPDTAKRQLGLGQALVSRLAQADPAADLDEAITHLRAGAENTAAHSWVRISAASTWGRAAARAREWDLAVAGYAAAVALLPLAAWHGLSRADREQQLVSWPGVARDAAACALQAGRLELAVELLEQGRAVLWGQMLQTRADLTELAASHPELASRLAGIRRILDRADAQGLTDADGPAATEGRAARRRDGERRMSAASNWDALLTTVQALPGFRDFLQPVPFSQLIRAADGGPVVVVNVSRIRCDALILSQAGLRVLPLEKLTWDSVAEHGDAYLHAIQRLSGYGADQLDRDEIDSRLAAIDATLGWLWDAVAEPVLAVLGYTRTPAGSAFGWPRIWWSATGPLSMLPLHAAGHYGSARAGEAISVMDRVVSSYTPTLSAMIRARQAGTGSAQRRRLLVVAMSAAPGDAGLPALPGARAEASWLGARFPGVHTRCADGQATTQAVLRLIPDHAIAHFTCHGIHDLMHPGLGGLLLRDGALSIPRIAGLDLRRVELAFLSACQTALGGVRLLDESVHLGAAFQLAGYRHVIGTLWTVADRGSAEVVAEIYRAMSCGPDESLEALDVERAAIAVHQAVRRLRDRRVLPLRWIPYVHIGP
jgi:tetratricopeptide (TPR) repeat protein